MYQSIFTLLLALLVSAGSMAQSAKLKDVKVTESVSLGMPETFRLMTDDEIADAFFSYRKPTACYKDEYTGAILSVNSSATNWQEGDMDMLHLFYLSTLKNTYSDVEFIQDKVIEVGKRKFIVFEFTSAVDEVLDPNMPQVVTPVGGGGTVRKYHYMVYAVHEGKVLLFNFSCPLKEQQMWAPTAQQIMDSIKLK